MTNRTTQTYIERILQNAEEMLAQIDNEPTGVGTLTKTDINEMGQSLRRVIDVIKKSDEVDRPTDWNFFHEMKKVIQQQKEKVI